MRYLILGIRGIDHLRTYFQDDTSLGILLYEEWLRAGAPVDRSTRAQLADELRRASGMIAKVMPSGSLSALRSAIDDVCNIDQHRGIAEDFLQGLLNAGVPVSSEQAIQFFPGEVFGGAYRRGEVFRTSAHEEVQKLSAGERNLLTHYWQIRSTALFNNEDFKVRFEAILM